MPLQPIEPVFLVADIAYEYVMGAAGAVGLGFAAMWRASRSDITSARTENKESWLAVQAALAVNAKLLEIQRTQEQTLAQQQAAIAHLLELQGTSVAGRSEMVAGFNRRIDEITSALRILDTGHSTIIRELEARRATG